jgi:hypothetical protein
MYLYETVDLRCYNGKYSATHNQAFFTVRIVTRRLSEPILRFHLDTTGLLLHRQLPLLVITHDTS